MMLLGVAAVILAVAFVLMQLNKAAPGSSTLLGSTEVTPPPGASINPNNSAGHIAVSAMGAAYATPEQAQMYVYINGTGLTTQQATQQLAMNIAAFNTTIMPFINSNLSDIQTSGYSVGKGYLSDVYTATESLSITIPDINNASAALGALSALPGVYVSDVYAALSQQQSHALRDIALVNALANATDQASVLAGPKGIIQQENITVTSSYYPVYYGSLMGASGGFQGTPSASPGIYAGRSAVYETVTVTFSYHG